jgi:phosphoglycerate dehydrogenase-like enzyme
MNAAAFSPGSRPRAALAFRGELENWLFPSGTRARLERSVELVTTPFTEADGGAQAERLREVEILIGSWGVPRLDAALLSQMPKLRAVFYGAGTVREFVTPEFWARGIALSSAAAANASPTATFAEAMIVLSLKQTWFYLRNPRPVWPTLDDTPSSGVHGAVVGIIGLSRVGRGVVAGLQRHELRLLAHDPTVSPAEAAQLGVELVSLPELFAQSDVVSLHAPLLPQTIGLVRGAHLRAMRSHTTFVNTARGAIVDEAEMVEVLRARPDLTAVLDVTDPEPAPADSPLRTLPNVVLTPHLAGARHREIELLGRIVCDELERYLAGQPLHWPVTAADAARQA